MKKFNFKDRRAQKQASREGDLRRLDDGEIYPDELRRENSFIPLEGFRGKKIGFLPKCKHENGDRWFSPEGRVCRADGTIEKWRREDDAIQDPDPE